MPSNFQWISSVFEICIDKVSGAEAGEALAGHKGPQHLPGHSLKQTASNSAIG